MAIKITKNGEDYLMHYLPGQTAKKHKYITIDANGNYIYPEDLKGNNTNTATTYPSAQQARIQQQATRVGAPAGNQSILQKKASGASTPRATSTGVSAQQARIQQQGNAYKTGAKYTGGSSGGKLTDHGKEVQRVANAKTIKQEVKEKLAAQNEASRVANAKSIKQNLKTQKSLNSSNNNTNYGNSAQQARIQQQGNAYKTGAKYTGGSSGGKLSDHGKEVQRVSNSKKIKQQASANLDAQRERNRVNAGAKEQTRLANEAQAAIRSSQRNVRKASVNEKRQTASGRSNGQSATQSKLQKTVNSVKTRLSNVLKKLKIKKK